MLPQQILCAFSLICFDQQISDQICSKGCECYTEFENSKSAVCEASQHSLTTPFPYTQINTFVFNAVNYAINFNTFFANKISINNLVIHDSQIDFWTADGYNLFEHIHGVKYLTISDSNIVGWNWDKIVNSLTTINGINIDNCSFGQITDKFALIATNEVNYLSITISSITNIDVNAMSWPNLKMITLKENNLTEVNRNWFAQQLNSLWSLDLSHNKIIEIPFDFFDDMPALTHLKLDHNYLETLEWDSVKSVWNNLRVFEIYRNFIGCTEKLSWIASKDSYPLFFDDGYCRHVSPTTGTAMIEFSRIFSVCDIVDPNACGHITEPSVE